MSSDNNICAICLEECVEDNCMIWWCEHIFHKECMNKYLEYDNMKCPMCRMEIKNIVDLSDKVDIYVYNNIKYEKEIDEEDNLLLYKEKLEILVKDLKDCYLYEYRELEGDLGVDDKLLFEEMIWFNY